MWLFSCFFEIWFKNLILGTGHPANGPPSSAWVINSRVTYMNRNVNSDEVESGNRNDRSNAETDGYMLHQK